jgi:hypothetical protein
LPPIPRQNEKKKLVEFQSASFFFTAGSTTIRATLSRKGNPDWLKKNPPDPAFERKKFAHKSVIRYYVYCTVCLEDKDKFNPERVQNMETIRYNTK